MKESMPINRRLSIGIISQFPFPTGLAATARIIAYSLGLIHHNVAVDVILPFEILGEKFSSESSGTYKKINYYYTYARSKPRYKLLRIIELMLLIRKFSTYKYAIRFLRIRNKVQPYTHIFVTSDYILPMIVFSGIAKRMGVRAIFVSDEYPEPIRRKLKDRVPMWKEAAYRTILKRFDAYVFISDTLSIYYNRLCPKPTHIMQVITDVTRFSGITCDNELSLKHYLCYMGNMELAKDNVDLIIKAFAMISNEYPDIDLHLYGSPSNRTCEYLSRIINSMNLSERVFIKGRAEYEDVPKILVNAHILLASQPQTMRASGGFPTKLGEYLASGKPSIITRVGENDRYVKDGKHVYFVAPENIEAYADRISYILNNYDTAMLVAHEGRKLIIENYSQSANGLKLKQFIKSIV